LADRLTAEVVIVGAGPAGIAAAVHAAESRRRVVVLDPSPRPGGQVWRHHGEPPHAARPWLARLAGSGASVLCEASVVDAPAQDALLVERLGRAVVVRFEKLVLATGARELFLPFPGWTLPGVIGTGAAQALRESGARFDGRRVVVAGSGPLLFAAAAALVRAGARIVGIAEQAPAARIAAFGAGLILQPRKLAEALGYAARLRGVSLRTGAWVLEALGCERLERVIASDGRREWAWDCDLLACGFGLVPNLELARLVGCETTVDGVVIDDSQRTSVRSVFAAGELCGVAGVGQALVTGAIAGLAAAGVSVPRALLRRRRRERAFAARLSRAFALRDELRTLARPDTIVCRCEDVTLARIEDAARPDPGRIGMTRCVKLHTRAGMGACQGRVCGAALSFLFGWRADTIRPPLLPAPLSVLAEGGEDGPARVTQEEEP
jgi:NADPH-dependent 2,4-dienoyl-CoA reductase/sulfur reductase-like enzyme